MNPSIIIVEDEGLIALDLKGKLEQLGYAVPLIADTAIGALAGVEHLRPSLVLMDIRLRGPQDGIETADRIRRQFHVPVLYVTAHADRETLDRAGITEPFGYIVKPFHNVDFRAQIEMALWKHRMEQKLRIGESWLSTTFRHVSDALIATDCEGNIAFMNTAASELTGWPWREAKGKSLADVFQTLEESTGLPANHPLEAIEAIYAGREPGTQPRAFMLRNRRGPDSVPVEAELYANRDEASLLGTIVVFRDVSERRKAQKQNLQLQQMNSVAVGLGKELAESQRRMDRSLKQLIAHSEGFAPRLLSDVCQCSAEQQSFIQQLVALGSTDELTARSLRLAANAGQGLDADTPA